MASTAFVDPYTYESPMKLTWRSVVNAVVAAGRATVRSKRASSKSTVTRPGVVEFVESVGGVPVSQLAAPPPTTLFSHEAGQEVRVDRLGISGDEAYTATARALVFEYNALTRQALTEHAVYPSHAPTVGDAVY